MQKQSDGTFPSLNTNLFTAVGEYYICWKSPYISFEAYTIASDAFWVVREVPTIHEISRSFPLNQNLEYFILEGYIDYFDEFQLFEGTPDCSPGNEIGNLNINSNRQKLYSWLPETA